MVVSFFDDSGVLFAEHPRPSMLMAWVVGVMTGYYDESMMVHGSKRLAGA